MSNHKGQHLTEYALILSLVLAVLVTMQTYTKRGLQGRYRDAVDGAVLALQEAKGDFSLPLQYEPYYVDRTMDTTQGPDTLTRIESLGGSISTTMDTTYQRSGLKITSEETDQ